jgi:hypothetical protein
MRTLFSSFTALLALALLIRAEPEKPAPKTEEPPLLGLTLVCEYDGNAKGGRVFELDKDGKERWAITGLNGPNSVQLLPDDRVLIAERNANMVTERNRKGEILWKRNDQQSPIACQRLPSGNTLITTFGELYEVTAGTKPEKVHSLPGSFRHATRLQNGHIVFITSAGRITELDESWKELRTVVPEKYASGAGFWASVEPLANGRLLVALGGQSRVIEVDWNGKIHWDITQPQCVFATRLPNGNTLVSCFENRVLVEVDRGNGDENKIVTTTKLAGRPFTVRRY